MFNKDAAKHTVTETITEAISHSTRRTDIRIRDLNVYLEAPSSSSFLHKLLSRSTNVEAAQSSCSKAILNNLSADIRGGTLTAIVGSSGCGKTTLLSTISKRLTDSKLYITGEIAYNGMCLDFGANDKNDLSIPYVVQEDNLLPQLTVEETLKYAAELRLPALTREKREERVRDVINDLGLSGCTHTRVGDHLHRGCSGGQKRRTSVAIQMLTDKSVLFLDEPTTGLDAASALQMVKILKSLAEHGKTVVMTSTYTLGLSDRKSVV